MVGVRATLIGAAAIGGAVTLAALFLPNMRAIEGEAGPVERGAGRAAQDPAPERARRPTVADARG
jgi:hypothetical protein